MSVKAGDKIPLYPYVSRFHLPKYPWTPVIMVAGGTGVAPFRFESITVDIRRYFFCA